MSGIKITLYLNEDLKNEAQKVLERKEQEHAGMTGSLSSLVNYLLQQWLKKVQEKK